eukprot:scaffold9_cov58-Attheya_sp.AAC.4
MEEDAASWAGTTAMQPTTGSGGKKSETDRTALVSARLKQIYRKAVFPVEKRHRYDYFYESPFLTDVEFECTFRQAEHWHDFNLLGLHNVVGLYGPAWLALRVSL